MSILLHTQPAWLLCLVVILDQRQCGAGIFPALEGGNQFDRQHRSIGPCSAVKEGHDVRMLSSILLLCMRVCLGRGSISKQRSFTQATLSRQERLDVSHTTAFLAQTMASLDNANRPANTTPPLLGPTTYKLKTFKSGC